MWRYLVGAGSALVLVAGGFLFFRSGAKPGQPLFKRTATAAAYEAKSAPARSTAEEAREQKQFLRYDKDRNGEITRDEYLEPREKAFAKLDTNHDGKLSFDEWAIRAENKFEKADADRSGALTPAEFATLAAARKAR